MDSSRPSEGPSPIPPSPCHHQHHSADEEEEGRPTKQPLQSKRKALDPKPKKKAPHGKEKELEEGKEHTTSILIYVFLCLHNKFSINYCCIFI